MSNDAPPRNYGGLFVDEDVSLTGKPWLNCVFNNCRVTLTEYTHPISGCVFDSACQLFGAGWAEWSGGRMRGGDETA